MNMFQFVLIVWAANGVADARPQNHDLTAMACTALVQRYHDTHATDQGPVPACVPDDVDF